MNPVLHFPGILLYIKANVFHRAPNTDTGHMTFSFKQAYVWNFFYAVNIGLIKEAYVVYAGVFNHKQWDDFSFLGSFFET